MSDHTLCYNLVRFNVVCCCRVFSHLFIRGQRTTGLLLPMQDLASVCKGQDPLHLHVFCWQRGTDCVVGCRSEPDASAYGSDDGRILAGKFLFL